MATAVKKKAGKVAGKKKRWTSGTYRSCSVCKKPDHNVRTCPKAKKTKGKKK